MLSGNSGASREKLAICSGKFVQSPHGIYHGIHQFSGKTGIYHDIYHSQGVIHHGVSSFDLFLPNGIYHFWWYMAWYISIFSVDSIV